jgi:ubiquinone biosynthesis protein UbiJ
MTNPMHNTAASLLNALPNPDTLASLPLQFLDGVQRFMSRNPPPTWLVSEVQNKLLLLINHVLDQEPQATARLARHKGKRIAFDWGGLHVNWLISPAGLLMGLSANDDKAPDLRIDLQDAAFSDVAKAVMQGTQPEIKMHGDVMLAAELGWLREHVRWDIEDDLARVIGDVPAMRISNMALQVVAAAKTFVAKRQAPTEAPAP